MHFRTSLAAVRLVFLAAGTIAKGPYQSLGDLFDGQLANITEEVPGNVELGDQNLGHCCNLAVYQSLELVDGYVQFKPGQTSLQGDMSSFLSYQYPCTASYNGSAGGPPQVIITYNWCRKYCNGWKKSRNSVQSDWLLPFAGFILPTVVFCFSVPRRRVFAIPPRLFPHTSIFEFPGSLTLFYKLPLAVIIMVLDTVQWVIVCIAMAGPMLVAGIFEAALDARIMRYLRSNNHLSSRRKAHLLLLILIGNLDETPAWEHSKEILSALDDNVIGTNSTTATSKGDAEITQPLAGHASKQTSPHGPDNPFQEVPSTTTPAAFRIVKRQIISLLESHTPFGTAVGIGVLFFASSFFYSIAQIEATYGDGGTAHSLAFGCFWMTIGHVAVVVGVMLANPYPSAWEGVAAAAEESSISDSQPQYRYRLDSITGFIRRWSVPSLGKRGRQFVPAFRFTLYRHDDSSRYKTVWMWNRGLAKARWLACFADEYNDMNIHTKVIRMAWIQLIFGIAMPAIWLLFIPSFLGALTSYTTPTIGLSCRSMGPVIFMSSQVLLIILWLCDWKFYRTTKDGKVLTAQATQEIRRPRLSIADIIWYTLLVLALSGAVVSAVGGTMFQTMGLYTNCLCWIPIWYWANRNSPDITTYLGNNSDEQIYYAKQFWIPIGVSATLFLILTTYLGWQYQRRLRIQFVELLRGIDSG